MVLTVSFIAIPYENALQRANRCAEVCALTCDTSVTCMPFRSRWSLQVQTEQPCSRCASSAASLLASLKTAKQQVTIPDSQTALERSHVLVPGLPNPPIHHASVDPYWHELHALQAHSSWPAHPAIEIADTSELEAHLLATLTLLSCAAAWRRSRIRREAGRSSCSRLLLPKEWVLHDSQ